MARVRTGSRLLDVQVELVGAATIQPAERRSVAEIKNALNVSRLDYTIVSRGNVIPVEAWCVEHQCMVYVIYRGCRFSCE